MITNIETAIDYLLTPTNSINERREPRMFDPGSQIIASHFTDHFLNFWHFFSLQEQSVKPKESEHHNLMGIMISKEFYGDNCLVFPG